MDDIISSLPKTLFGNDLKRALLNKPEYSEEYRRMEPGARLLKLLDIYKVFIPQTMAAEIYHKLYMMTLMSLQQKGTSDEVRRLNVRTTWSMDFDYHGIATGTSSSSVIGDSGIGKTTCVQKASGLIGPVIEIKRPLRKIIPVIVVTCPFDCNYKGLLNEILMAIDMELGTDNYERARKNRYSSQDLMALVCHLCMLHVGVLIIDEIQFIIKHRSGTMLYQMILQLINTSRINVLLVGTNECLDFFQQGPQMARRVVGLRYGNLRYGEEFREIVRMLWGYQYIRERAGLTEGMVSWLYDHTAGNIGSLMNLIHDAQEIAIIRGTEKLDINSLVDAYSKRLNMLHPFIEMEKKTLPKSSKAAKKEAIAIKPETAIIPDSTSVLEASSTARESGQDAVDTYRGYYEVEEVDA